MFFKVIGILALANAAMAICPGFNYGISEAMDAGQDTKRWIVYDADCNQADRVSLYGAMSNPCNMQMFGCSPPPIIFNRYTNLHTGLSYACRRDPNSGSCDGQTISVCCRNDGN